MFNKYYCPNCGGDGKETCHNPDHSFIHAVGGETSRLGCPGCGHDEEHKTGGSYCETCFKDGESNGLVSLKKHKEFIKVMRYDYNDYKPELAEKISLFSIWESIKLRIRRFTNWA